MSDGDIDSLSALVVDDDAGNRDLLVSLLHEVGVQDVRWATDGQAALTRLRNFRPDFIVCDIMMKPMDGIAFTRSIRTGDLSPNPYVPIILVTGDTRIEIVHQARDAGAHGFIAKPISLNTLRKRLETVLADKRQFIKSPSYTGPDRRRRQLPLGKRHDRRLSDD
jgi:two-component system, chemotaxis family, chemotaxis protein CheY